MNNLTLSDINTCVDRQEPRIHDLRLAEMLKFTRPRKIRDLIKQHENANVWVVFVRCLRTL